MKGVGLEEWKLEREREGKELKQERWKKPKNK